MATRLRFTRNSVGDFDFSESKLTRLNAALRSRVGQQGPMLPETIMQAASAELVRAVHRMADQRKSTFGEAATRVVRERPELFWLTRGISVNDGDGSADVEVGE